MAERCPLGLGLYWNNSSQIPEFCLERCEALWRKASMDTAVIDIFSEDCMDNCDIEYGDEALQRTKTSEGYNDSGRQYSILNMCGVHPHTEMFAEEYFFECPNN